MFYVQCDYYILTDAFGSVKRYMDAVDITLTLEARSQGQAALKVLSWK